MPININRILENLETLSNYIIDNDGEWESLADYIREGNAPEEHILFTAFFATNDSDERKKEWTEELEKLNK